MSLWKRIKRLFQAQAHATLDRLESPEKELELLADELREQHQQSRRRLLDALAEQTRLERQEKQLRDTIDRWEQRAMEAVRAGNDILAKEALAEKAKQERQWSSHLEELQVQREAVEALKAAEEQLSRRIGKALRRHQEMASRLHQADALGQMGETISTQNPNSPLGTLSQIDRDVAALEEQVVLQQHTHSGVTEAVADQEFRAAQHARDRDATSREELAALKQKLRRPVDSDE